MALVPTNYKPVPINRIYFFEGYYIGVQDAVLDHVNFISVVNDSNVIKTIFPATKLSKLRDMEE